MASYINYLVNAQLIIQPDPLAMIMCSYIAQNRIGIIIQTRMMEVVCVCVCRQFCELLAGLNNLKSKNFETNNVVVEVYRKHPFH